MCRIVDGVGYLICEINMYEVMYEINLVIKVVLYVYVFNVMFWVIIGLFMFNLIEVIVKVKEIFVMDFEFNCFEEFVELISDYVKIYDLELFYMLLFNLYGVLINIGGELGIEVIYKVL